MIITAVVCFSITGLILGIILSIAGRYFNVKVDLREEKILDSLPGINCGACGYPGCGAYAAAIIEKKEELTKCIPGGNETAEKLGLIMGIQAGRMEKRVARVFCNGGRDKSPERFIYSGISSCTAVNITGGGNKACVYGCLGLGDCMRSCPFDAIVMRDDAIPHIDEEKCTSCGKCVIACPRQLIDIIPKDKKVIVACKSRDTGAEVRKNCTVGCTACKLCVKACSSQAITVEDNLACIHPSTCTLQKACIPTCPRHTIIEYPKTIS
ncbi:MAG: RnfABCDGE type electron transport complex subunit B [bacterium]